MCEKSVSHLQKRNLLALFDISSHGVFSVGLKQDPLLSVVGHCAGHHLLSLSVGLLGIADIALSTLRLTVNRALDFERASIDCEVPALSLQFELVACVQL